jgi:hypothetical protein
MSSSTPASTLFHIGQTPKGPKGAVTSGQGLLLPERRDRGIPAVIIPSKGAAGSPGLSPWIGTQGQHGTK